MSDLSSEEKNFPFLPQPIKTCLLAKQQRGSGSESSLVGPLCCLLFVQLDPDPSCLLHILLDAVLLSTLQPVKHLWEHLVGSRRAKRLIETHVDVVLFQFWLCDKTKSLTKEPAEFQLKGLKYRLDLKTIELLSDWTMASPHPSFPNICRFSSRWWWGLITTSTCSCTKVHISIWDDNIYGADKKRTPAAPCLSPQVSWPYFSKVPSHCFIGILRYTKKVELNIIRPFWFLKCYN